MDFSIIIFFYIRVDLLLKVFYVLTLCLDPSVVVFCHRWEIELAVVVLKRFCTGRYVCLLEDVSNFQPDTLPNQSHRKQLLPYKRSSATRNPSPEILPKYHPEKKMLSLHFTGFKNINIEQCNQMQLDV